MEADLIQQLSFLDSMTNRMQEIASLRKLGRTKNVSCKNGGCAGI
jgi:hypothetical protein